MSLQHPDVQHPDVQEARRLGVALRSRVVLDKGWTAAEDDTLRRLYPDYEAMVLVLRHRSYFALRNQCGKLGLQRRKHVWTTADNARLAKAWTRSTMAELRVMFPGLSDRAIANHGSFLGLGPRGKPPYAPTGNWLCDAIRDRCRVLGYTMRELDELVIPGSRYFQTSAWSSSGHSWSHLVRAAKVLGGDLRVEWPD